MLEAIKRILSEYSGIDYKLVKNNMHLEDDLFLDELDLEEVLNELEDYFGCEFDERDTEIVYVSDLVALVKEAV